MSEPTRRVVILAMLVGAVGLVFALRATPPLPASTQLLASSHGAPAGADRAGVRLPRMVDLGADRCVPCKAMAPILASLRTDYADRFEVVFIDVWKDPDAGRPYRIYAIPTQIFFDPDGRELYRHQGFFSRDDILGTWARLGYDMTPGSLE